MAEALVLRDLPLDVEDPGGHAAHAVLGERVHGQAGPQDHAVGLGSPEATPRVKGSERRTGWIFVSAHAAAGTAEAAAAPEDASRMRRDMRMVWPRFGGVERVCDPLSPASGH
nr:hypothetical protein GCM10025732_57080 [Glycomyces mayteni]